MSWFAPSRPAWARRAHSGAWPEPRWFWRSPSGSPSPSVRRSSWGAAARHRRDPDARGGPAEAGSARPGRAPGGRAASLAGVEILESVPLLTPALDVVGAHHERWDGSGYPRGLREDAIPLTARIFAVVDALDAMTHDRPHRDARSVEEALMVVREEAGKQFDPRVAELARAMPAARWAELLGAAR